MTTFKVDEPWLEALRAGLNKFSDNSRNVGALKDVSTILESTGKSDDARLALETAEAITARELGEEWPRGVAPAQLHDVSHAAVVGLFANGTCKRPPLQHRESKAARTNSMKGFTKGVDYTYPVFRHLPQQLRKVTSMHSSLVVAYNEGIPTAIVAKNLCFQAAYKDTLYQAGLRPLLFLHPEEMSPLTSIPWNMLVLTIRAPLNGSDTVVWWVPGRTYTPTDPGFNQGHASWQAWKEIGDRLALAWKPERFVFLNQKEHMSRAERAMRSFAFGSEHFNIPVSYSVNTTKMFPLGMGSPLVCFKEARLPEWTN